jgi:pyruvate dehydrogenase E2 component (dihydrolipoamide acetyltransferase)
MRQTIARVTTQSKQQVPHIYLTVEVMMDAAMALRQQLNAALEGEGVKLSVNDLVVKATAKALAKHRNMNASYAGDTIIQHPTVDIGIAVSLDQGLITPIIRDADKKALSTISQETRDLAGRARSGGLKLEEFSGGTFTISNLGMFNIEEFDAIIVQPQAGILAVGAAAQRPVVKDGQLAIATTMKMTLSADHRVTDGTPAAAFINEIRRLLETPLLLLA